MSTEGVWFLAEMHCQSFILACQYSAPPYFCIPQGPTKSSELQNTLRQLG